MSEDSFTGGLKMVAESIQSIYEARCSKLKQAAVDHSQSGAADGWVDQFHRTISEYSNGNCPIDLEYIVPSAVGQLSWAAVAGAAKR